MTAAELALLPFIERAAAHVRRSAPPLKELLTSWPGRAAVLRRAEERIARSPEAVGVSLPAGDAEAEVELLSYPVARLIVSALKERWFINRLAVNEGKALTALMRGGPLPVPEEEVFEALGLEVEEEDHPPAPGMEYRVHWTHYLRFVPEQRDKWLLSHRPVVEGFVLMNREDLARIAGGALQRRIMDELPLPFERWIAGALSDSVEKLRPLRREVPRETGGVRFTRFPPCMRLTLARLQAGENIAHAERFAVTSFLHTIGFSAEEIMKIFSTAPDFSAERTRYQVEHITGVTSSKEYTPPDCGTMLSRGICPERVKKEEERDPLCRQEWLTHPLKYYRAKGRRGRGRAGARPEPDRNPSEGSQPPSTG